MHFSYMLCFSTLFFLPLLLINSSLSSRNLYSPQPQPQPQPQGIDFEGKGRLGSRPPSCHNKCNQCHPCMAVQVSTMPSHDRVPPAASMKHLYEASSSTSSGRYSNYKPLGWKCRCRDHFYNP